MTLRVEGINERRECVKQHTWTKQTSLILNVQTQTWNSSLPQTNQGREKKALFLLREGLDCGKHPCKFMKNLCGYTISVLLLLAITSPAFGHALTDAIMQGNAEEVQRLLAAGTEVDVRDNYGNTALHDAAFSGHLAIVTLLLEAGADVNVRNEQGETALHKVVSTGHLERIASRKQGGAAVLQDAIHYNHSAIVNRLLAAEADVNVRNDRGETALHKAAWSANPAIVKLLLEAGIEVNARERAGETALHRAARSGHSEIVKLLLEAGIEVNLKDKYGYTALHRAICSPWSSPRSSSRSICSGYSEIVKLLESAGAL